MDDEDLRQEGYFEAFAAVINALDPRATDFEFQLSNLRKAVQISQDLTPAERQCLSTMLRTANAPAQSASSLSSQIDRN